MTLRRLTFFWGIRIKSDFNMLIVSTGSAQKKVLLSPGLYSPRHLAAMIELSLRRDTGASFQVDFDFDQERLKITCPIMFTIHIASSDFGGGKAYSDLGFGNTDFTGTIFQTPLPIDSLRKLSLFASSYSDFEENTEYSVGDVATGASPIFSSFFYLDRKKIATITFGPIAKDFVTRKLLPSPFDECPTLQDFNTLFDAIAQGNSLDFNVDYEKETVHTVQSIDRIASKSLITLSDDTGLFQSQPVRLAQITILD